MGVNEASDNTNTYGRCLEKFSGNENDLSHTLLKLKRMLNMISYAIISMRKDIDESTTMLKSKKII